MKHTRKRTNARKKHMLLLSVFLVAAVALILGATAPDSWASGWGWGDSEEFEDAECGFEVNVTDFDTGFFACVDAEGWKSLQIYRKGENHWYKELLYWAWATGKLGKLGITENCFESSEPEGKFQEILDMFKPGECKFKGKTVEGDYLKSTDDLTHDFACPAEDIVFTSIPCDEGCNAEGEKIDLEEEDACVPAGLDLVISWNAVVNRVLDSVFFVPPPPNGEEEEEPEVDFECVADAIVIEGYQVFVETQDEVELSQELSFDPFDDGTSVTVPGAFLKEGTEYKFEVLVIEESGNKTIREIEFETCEEE